MALLYIQTIWVDWYCHNILKKFAQYIGSTVQTGLIFGEGFINGSDTRAQHLATVRSEDY